MLPKLLIFIDPGFYLEWTSTRVETLLLASLKLEFSVNYAA